ncbi:MAG: MotA/TolQ/ExbB proton channel family protein [Planctomycetota bacterium]
MAVSSAAIAQDGDDAAGEFGDDGGAAVVDDQGAAGADQNGGGAADDGDGTAKKKKDQSLLGWTIESLGYTYLIVFLLLSFTLVSLLVMNLLAVQRSKLVPQDLVEQFEEKLNEQQFQDAYDMARMDESVLGQILTAGLGNLSLGYPKAVERMQEVGEEEAMKLDHRLSYMNLIGNLSPMIGLFGTVQGMISSFQVIALSGDTPEPAALAAGISTALFTTLVGLAIAIPAIAAYNILRNRVARLMLEVGTTSETLMSRFEQQPVAVQTTPLDKE